MRLRRFVPLLALLVLGSFASLGFAAKKPSGAGGGGGGSTNYLSTVCTVSDFTPGVSSDGGGVYTDGVDGVRCYISVSKNDADLVTYNTGRTLHFDFPGGDPAVTAAGIPSSFDAVADMFGINYYGNYDSMGIGTTAQVQLNLQFYVGSVTYELDYAALAVIRLDANTWVITSESTDSPYAPFAFGPNAKLNVIRRRAQKTFGVVSMPFRITMVRK